MSPPAIQLKRDEINEKEITISARKLIVNINNDVPPDQVMNDLDYEG